MIYEQYFPLIPTLLAIGIGWVVLRSLIRMTKRIFSCGCLTIFGIGLLFLMMRYFGTV